MLIIVEFQFGKYNTFKNKKKCLVREFVSYFHIKSNNIFAFFSNIFYNLQLFIKFVA